MADLLNVYIVSEREGQTDALRGVFLHQQRAGDFALGLASLHAPGTAPPVRVEYHPIAGVSQEALLALVRFGEQSEDPDVIRAAAEFRAEIGNDA